jgi:hypothetical protein
LSPTAAAVPASTGTTAAGSELRYFSSQARGCTATYFPEGNVLVPIDSVADRSNTPTSKFIVISVAPSADAGAAAKEIRSAAKEIRRTRAF